MIPLNHFQLNTRQEYTFSDPGNLHRYVLDACEELGRAHTRGNSAFAVRSTPRGTHLYYRTPADIERVRSSLHMGEYQFSILFSARRPKGFARPHLIGDEVLPALQERFEQAGGQLIDAYTRPADYPCRSVRVPATGRRGFFRVIPTRVEGTLQVLDPDRMAEACTRAFGNYSGFGCGLLLLNEEN